MMNNRWNEQSKNDGLSQAHIGGHGDGPNQNFHERHQAITVLAESTRHAPVRHLPGCDTILTELMSGNIAAHTD